jgi:hypothetical protein
MQCNAGALSHTPVGGDQQVRRRLIPTLQTADANTQQERGLAQRCERIEGRPASADELTSVHAADYVQKICSLGDQASWGCEAMAGGGWRVACWLRSAKLCLPRWTVLNRKQCFKFFLIQVEGRS